MITIYDIIGYGIVGSMMALAFVITRFVSAVRFNEKGLWHIIVRAYAWNDYRYREWIRENRVYLWSPLLLVTLCATILGLIGSFSHNTMFDRPEWMLIVSFPMWFFIYKSYQWFTNKLKMM